MPQAIDLRAVNRGQFRSAKGLQAGASVAKLIAFAIGALAVFSSRGKYVPQLLLALAVFSDVLQIQSDVIKGRAEGLLRTLDLCRSFDKAISDADKRDIVAYAPRSVRRQVEESEITDSYFASTEKPGPRRSVENLLESAWYTRHQAFTMAITYLILLLAMVALAIAALMVALRASSQLIIQDQVAKIVTSWLMLAVSLSMARKVWSYVRMMRRCERTELTCGHLLRGKVSEADALRQWYEYQLARAASPLIPEVLWRLMGPRLEGAWRARAL